MDRPDLGDHKLQLARELLDGIELGGEGGSDSLLLKAIRLARLMQDDKALRWLNWELHGYPGGNDDALKLMKAMGRLTDAEKNLGYWMGLGEIEAIISTSETKLAALRIPDASGDYIAIALREIRQEQTAIANRLTKLRKIRARFKARLHGFATSTYYELAFADKQQRLFEVARAEVDSLLQPLSGDILSKVDSIYRRLAEDDPEAISQALNTCRRLVDSVADAVYPPREGTVDLGGNKVQVGTSHHQNRLNAYIHERTISKSRRSRLRRTLSDLYERVSAGVHTDVDATEARYLFLSAYSYLGEVLALSAPGECADSAST